MKKRRLGANGPLVSEIGLGCMSMSGFYGPSDDNEAIRLMAGALDLGVDFFDTANVYGMGHNETLIGRFLNATPKSRWPLLATKSGIKRDPVTKSRTFDNSRAYVTEMLDASFKRLGVDHVQLYYAHRRAPGFPPEEIAETMKSLIAAGRIGGYGLSEVSPDTIRRAHAVHPVTAVQSEYSLWTREPEGGVIQTCAELGIAFVPFGVVGRKILSGELRTGDQVAESDFRKQNPRFTEPNFSANLQRLQPFFALAARLGCTPAELAVAWVLAQGDHLIPIPGTRSIAHLGADVAAADLDLSPAVMTEIESILPKGFAAGPRYTEEQYVAAERY